MEYIDTPADVIVRTAQLPNLQGYRSGRCREMLRAANETFSAKNPRLAKTFRNP